MRTKTIELLEENIGINIHVFEFRKGFFDMTSKMWASKNS